jgi:hypothetical protein
MPKLARLSVWVFACGCLLVAGAMDVYSQGVQGGIRGAVKDADGVIPGVDVTLINEATNVSRSTVSNDSGQYNFVGVTPGTYTLRAVLQAFKTFERKGLTIATQQVLTVDVPMEVGALEETVTVTGAAPLIETANASTGEVLDKATLQALPSLNRNLFLVGATVPTAFASGDPYFSRMEDQSNGSLVSLGGGPRRGNSYLLDGVSLTDMQNRTATFPSTESVEDLKIQVHTYDAEMGRSGGGAFNTTAKSGTNLLHGSALLMERLMALAATNYFDALAGRPKLPGAKYRQWAASIGGPIVKNRTFFYFTHEGYRTNTTLTNVQGVPTDREKAGDFSQSYDRDGKLVIIYDPLTTRQLPNGSYTRDPFPGNMIPANRMSTVAKNIQAYFPTATEQRSAANGIGNFIFSAPSPTDAMQYIGKIEHKLSDRVSMTGLYLRQRTHEDHGHWWGEANPFASPDMGSEVRPVDVAAINGLTVPNNTTTMTVRLGYTRFLDHIGGFEFDPAPLGFPSSFLNDIQFNRFPNGNIQGYTASAGGSFGNRTESGTDFYQWNVNGVITKLLGRQTVKVGGDYRQLRAVAGKPQGATGGQFNFDREWTQADPFVAKSDEGSAYANFLLGLPSGNPSNQSTAPVTTPINGFINSYAGFVQDDLRVTNTVTMNVGLRYEYETGLKETQNQFTVAFDRAVVSPLAAQTGLDLRGGLRYAGLDGFPTTQGNPSKKRFSPRVGATWKLSEKTVVRSGYGLFWSPWRYASPGTDSWGQLGYSNTTNMEFRDRLIPTASLDNPFPNGLLKPVGNSLGLLTGAGNNISFVDPNKGDIYVHQYSADIQRELGSRASASITYMGALGRNLDTGNININQLDPKYFALGSALNTQVPNPFYQIPQAGAFSTSQTIARGQLLRPFPQFRNVLAMMTTQGHSRFDAVIFSLTKRLVGGWGGRFNYTWSRLYDNSFENSSFTRVGGKLNNYDLESEYGVSGLNVPHKFAFSPIVQLPFGEGKPWLTSGFGERVLGGWQLAVVATYESGQPIGIVQASDNTGLFGGVQRPNWTGVDPNTQGSTLDRLNNYINPAAYSAAPPFTFGNAPRTDPRISSPFRTNYDMALSKSVKVGATAKVELKIEVMNATNNPKWLNGPGNAFGSPTFGVITSQAGFPRTTQATLRFNW